MDVTVTDSVWQALFGYGTTLVVAALVAGMIWAVVYILDHLHHRREAATKAAQPVRIDVAQQAPAVDETAHHVAVVAAAVYAALGASRFIFLGEGTGRGTVWSSTGRTIHQTSHLPKRAPKQ
jgi:hypothetical protein